MRDYYKVLNAVPTDAKEKIQETYRSISRRFREMPENEQRTTIAAYNVLIDDDKRKEYDSQPQFAIRKNCPKLASAGTKKKEGDRVPFRWGIPLIEIILMPFKGDKEDKKEQTNEEKANFHFTQGVLMAEDIKMLKSAKTEFESVITSVPGIREAHYNLGLVFYRMGKFSDALGQFKKCLEIESKDNHAKKMITLLE